VIPPESVLSAEDNGLSLFVGAFGTHIVIDHYSQLERVLRGLTRVIFSMRASEPAIPAVQSYWKKCISSNIINNELITDIFCRNLERYLQGRFDEMENILDKARMY